MLLGSVAGLAPYTKLLWAVAAQEPAHSLLAGVIVEMFYKNGLFLTTMVTDCGLPQHRGFYPTGATASCCGKLTVR